MNMKHGLYLFMFLLCGTGLQAQDRVVEQPAFDAWSSTTLEIDKIALSDTATVFYIDAYFRPKYWIQVVKETTLRADGKTYPIKTGDGITLSKKFWMPESGEASFRLIFPPLPKGTKRVLSKYGASTWTARLPTLLWQGKRTRRKILYWKSRSSKMVWES